MAKKKKEKVEKVKSEHCKTCGGSGFVESEVRCPACGVEEVKEVEDKV